LKCPAQLLAVSANVNKETPEQQKACIILTNDVFGVMEVLPGSDPTDMVTEFSLYNIAGLTDSDTLPDATATIVFNTKLDATPELSVQVYPKAMPALKLK
jgi:hypothetical protein